jgi:transcription-repair coupling factor (superfamily II helicase)
MLREIYGENISPLYVRPVSICCYQLEAELVGMYGTYEKRVESLGRLAEIKQLAESKIFKQNILANINESVAFVAIRCLPERLLGPAITPPVEKQIKMAEEALQRSIVLRENSLGSENEYVAVDYMWVVMLGALRRIPI